MPEVGGCMEERVEGLLVGEGLDMQKNPVLVVFARLFNSLLPLGFEPGAELGHALNWLDGGFFVTIGGAAKQNQDVRDL